MRPVIDVMPFFNHPGAVQSDLMPEKLWQSKDRDYIIQKVKDPLRKVLILVAKRLADKIGKVGKENTIFSSIHILLDKREKFEKLHHNPGRDDMLDAGWDVLLAIANDPYYEWLLRWLFWEMIEEYQKGNMPPLGEPPLVLKPCWGNKQEGQNG
jgi:hypothetical protein